MAHGKGAKLQSKKIRQRGCHDNAAHCGRFSSPCYIREEARAPGPGSSGLI